MDRYEWQFRDYAKGVVEGDIIEIPVHRLDIFGYTVYFWAVPKGKLPSGVYYGICEEHILGMVRDPHELKEGLVAFKRTGRVWVGFFERFFAVVTRLPNGPFARFL